MLLRTARVPDGFDEVAARNVQEQDDQTVRYLRRTNQRYEGTVAVTVEGVQGNRRVTVVEGCADATGLLVPHDEGDPRPGETTAFRATLNQSGGLWTVTEYGASDRTC
ncbi:hypothetical protein [Nocardioides massiliensis]|uniref:Secreted protein n=1 Tax=Nocardioides massiliensis TaxID=1325935 RepID=A0ABT9NJA6_9ACTN|nr:hypothetical protein [Nocardioides massiliensis]MDP9820307.1 hypothetical protein [Nocardioides massiliensis]